jgi:hypothetical protein
MQTYAKTSRLTSIEPHRNLCKLTKGCDHYRPERQCLHETGELEYIQ